MALHGDCLVTVFTRDVCDKDRTQSDFTRPTRTVVIGTRGLLPNGDAAQGWLGAGERHTGSKDDYHSTHIYHTLRAGCVGSC
jgi:hypothetical protein